MPLEPLAMWLEGSPPARFIATTLWAYPLVSAVHLLGIALVVGSALPVDLRLLRLVGPQFDPALESLVRTALVGFAVAAPSGVLLASVRMGEYLGNPAFLAKLLILLAAGANALLLRWLSGSRQVAAMVGRPAGRIAGGTSLVLWLAAVLAGRWIAFV